MFAKNQIKLSFRGRSSSTCDHDAARARFAQYVMRCYDMYQCADDFVLSVRSGDASVNDPEVLRELFRRYGRFTMWCEVVAFATSVWVVETMIGSKFGKGSDKVLPRAVALFVFGEMFQDALGTRREKAKGAKRVVSLAPIDQIPQLVALPAPEAVKEPSVPLGLNHEKLVEDNMLAGDYHDDLVVTSTIARVRSDAGVTLDADFVLRTIRVINERRRQESARKVAEVEMRRGYSREEPDLPEPLPQNGHNGNGHLPPRRKATNPLDLLDLLAQRGEFTGTDCDFGVLERAAGEDELPHKFLRNPKIAKNRIRDAMRRAAAHIG